MNQTSPLVVEFIGLPGSGKTTVAQLVTAELTLSGHRCFSLSTLTSPEGIKKKKGGVLQKLRTLYGFIVSTVLYSDITIHAVDYALQVRPLSRATFQRLVTFLIRLDFFRTVINGHFDVIILDQGSLQNIWSIATTGKKSDDNARLLKLIESVLRRFSMVVVRICIDVEDAVERVDHRSTMRSRFDEMSPEQVRTMLTQHSFVFSQIADMVANLHITRYLEVDGKQPPTRSANSITTFIKQVRSE